jgi:hypothetical protein
MVAILVSLIAATPAAATTTFPRERVCPVGGETYQSFEIASTSYSGIRLDLQRGGVGAFLPYVECPNGFIVYKDESKFTADEIAKLTPVVSSAEYQAARKADVPAVRVIMLQRAVGKSDADLRYWFFKAALEAEQSQVEALRHRHLEEAVEAHAAYLKEHTEHDDAWWFSAVRRADLLRQLARFDDVSAAIKDIRAAHGSENQIYLKVVAQIETRAAAHDANPAFYEDKDEPGH